MHSFRGPLLRWIQYVEPKDTMRILEWGPGESTKMMLDAVKDCEIYTIEHSRSWFARYSREFKKEKRVSVYHMLDKDEYVEAPKQWGRFHLVFIDGILRPECLETAFEVVRMDGLVLLHDINQPGYRKATDRFEIIFEEKDTAVMRKNKEKET